MGKKNKEDDIWANVPRDSKGNYLEAPTNEEGIVKASSGLLSVTSEPIEKEGDEIFVRQTRTVNPGGVLRWFTNGPQGARITMKLIRVPGSGGHNHGGGTTNSLAVGSIAPSSFTLGRYPQNVVTIQRAPMVCGSIRLLTTPSVGTGDEDLVNVLVPGLRPIPSSASLRLKPPTAHHPSPYFAKGSFISKLVRLASDYYAERNKPITVTDASLPWGGRFDLNRNWGPPHHEHMNGRQADIRSRDMNRRDKKVFKELCAKHGIGVLEESNHWHIRG